MPFHLRVLPEEQRVEKGLQAGARDWRRSECLKLISSQQQPDATAESEDVNVNKHIPNGSVKHFIATAHTHDDQLETLLMKLLRGVHLTNFQGVRIRYL